MDVTETAETGEGKCAVTRFTVKLLPLLQFGSSDLNVISYEHLCVQPEIEGPRIFRTIGLPDGDDVFDQIQRPSTATVPTSVTVTGEDGVTHWEGAFSSEHIRRTLSVVQGFSLDRIYRDSATPSTAALSRISAGRDREP